MERVRRLMRGVAVMAAMCAAAGSQAQEYEVSSFEHALKDMTARMAATSRVDANGRKCAVVKVYVNDNIREVHGPAVGQVADHGMEKWIYLSHDAKQMELLFDRHYPLAVTFIEYDYPSLTGQSTYILKLSDKKNDEDATAKPDDSSLHREIARLYRSREYQKCLELCMSNAEDAVCQYYIGRMYYYGRNMAKDYAEAAGWYRKAAEQGNENAQRRLGLMYKAGKGVEKDFTAAVEWLRKSSDQGNVPAQYYLGTMYNDGKGVAKDYAEAAGWFRKAADQGNEDAQCDLGLLYEKGRGVEKDLTEAAGWYRKAAEQGNARAQCNLGYLYNCGLGVEQSYKEAAGWYRKSAEQGFARAQYNLAIKYEHGQGVEKNYREAVEWYRKAARQGYKNAITKLEKAGETY